MAKLFKDFVRKTLYKKDNNLVSLDDWYLTVQRLLEGHQVHGILDAGASDGRITLKLLDCFTQANGYAFEPNPHYSEVLQGVAKTNDRFFPQFCGLSNTNGKVDLNVTDNIGSSSVFEPSPRFRQSHRKESELKRVVAIETATLDEWAQKNDSPTIEMMKLDIQGGELAALQGAKKMLSSSTLLIYTEILFNSMYTGGALFSDIDQFLRQFGFVLYNMYKPKSDQNGLLQQADAIYVHAEKLGI